MRLEEDEAAARQRLDISLAVALEQGARCEAAQTMLARGRAGSHFGWRDADADLATARVELEAMGANLELHGLA